MSSDTTIDPERPARGRGGAGRRRPALVVLHCREEPARVGELCFAPSGSAEPLLLGRGPARRDDPHARVEWVRQRPARNDPRSPLSASAVSRRQLRIQPASGGLRVENLGRRALRVDGSPVASATVREGQVLSLDGELVLAVTSRPVALPPARAWPEPLDFPFGAPDPFGMVGESEAMWSLRDRLAFAAPRPLHVLLHGPSGTGKELAARALHGLAAPGEPLLSRNASTLPDALLDAELFGNRADYPNPGMPERPGLVGAADGGTLFLDEIGELPESAQAHLLRVLDAGEYQRLGESRLRTSRFRLIGATNRPLEQLKHDLLARLTLRIALPPLSERPEDLPLLAQALVDRAVAGDDALRAQFAAEGRVRLAPELVEALFHHRFPLGVRELLSLLWRCLGESPGDVVRASPSVLRGLARTAPCGEVDPESLAPEAIAAALDEHDWVVAKTWRPLGLRSRHALNRLIKKHGLTRPG